MGFSQLFGLCFVHVGLSGLTVRARAHRFLAQAVPEINLDAFNFCFEERWRVGELTYYNLMIAFGMPLLFNRRHTFTRKI